MRKLGLIAGLAAIAGAMSMNLDAHVSSGSRVYSKSPLSKKQKKVRNKNKAAKKARRLNRK